jgi:hypothetical protein
MVRDIQTVLLLFEVCKQNVSRPVRGQEAGQALYSLAIAAPRADQPFSQAAGPQAERGPVKVG